MKFKDFQAPVLFSSTFKASNLGEKNSSTFKYFQGCMGTLSDVVSPRRGILERKVANCCSVTFTCRSLMQKSTITAMLSTVKLPQEIYTGDVTIGP